jgi:hypothetical protein
VWLGVGQGMRVKQSEERKKEREKKEREKERKKEIESGTQRNQKLREE